MNYSAMVKNRCWHFRNANLLELFFKMHTIVSFDVQLSYIEKIKRGDSHCVLHCSYTAVIASSTLVKYKRITRLIAMNFPIYHYFLITPMFLYLQSYSVRNVDAGEKGNSGPIYMTLSFAGVALMTAMIVGIIVMKKRSGRHPHHQVWHSQYSITQYVWIIF